VIERFQEAINFAYMEEKINWGKALLPNDLPYIRAKSIKYF
jgi:hypothetical protein